MATVGYYYSTHLWLRSTLRVYPCADSSSGGAGACRPAELTAYAAGVFEAAPISSVPPIGWQMQLGDGTVPSDRCGGLEPDGGASTESTHWATLLLPPLNLCLISQPALSQPTAGWMSGWGGGGGGGKGTVACRSPGSPLWRASSRRSGRSVQKTCPGAQRHPHGTCQVLTEKLRPA